MKKFCSLFLILLVVLQISLPVFAVNKKEIIEEMISYAKDELEEIQIPLSPSTDFDLYLWKRVKVTQRKATIEEIQSVKSKIIIELKNIILQQSPEVLNKSLNQYKKIVKSGFTYEWWDPSSAIDDYELSGRYENKALNELFAQENKKIDKEFELTSLDTNKTKDRYIEEIIDCVNEAINVLEIPFTPDKYYDTSSSKYISITPRQATQQEVKIAKENCLSKIKECLLEYDANIISVSINEIKKIVNKVSYFEWQDQESDKDFKLKIVIDYSSVKRKLDEIKIKLENEEYRKLWKEGMPSCWAWRKIEYAINNGYVPKNLQNNYQKNITREEFTELFVTVLFSDFNKSISKEEKYKKSWEFDLLTLENFLSKVNTTNSFNDTTNKYIKIANILGIINGDENKNFNPYGLIKREQAATMIANYYQTVNEYTGDDTIEQIDDFNLISPWAKEAVKIAYGAGYMNGTKQYKADYSEERVIQMGHFDPKGNLTREQAILIICKAQEINSTKNCLLLNGLIPVGMDSIMSGFDVDDNTIKMKRSGYHNFEVAADRYMSSHHFKTKTSYIISHTLEELNAIYLLPYCFVNHSMYNESNIDKVLNGEQTFYDYDVFTVEHNKDGYLVVITKKKNNGYIYQDCIFKEDKLVQLKVINDTIDQYNDHEAEAEVVAKNIINRVIKSGMSDREKIEAIKKTLDNHGYYWDTPLYHLPMGGGDDYHSAYNALVEKFSNYSGWYYAYRMIFELIGLELNPENGSEADKYNFSHKGVLTGKIAVKVDGIWEYVDFLPPKYNVPTTD
ncbi:MAG: S-layer homology domain-containing protein [Vallitalea sp.]|jgi:hypothetical protein|nr:S-layer homology domain-containing protein [Vallitalea sp.]